MAEGLPAAKKAKMEEGNLMLSQREELKDEIKEVKDEIKEVKDEIKEVKDEIKEVKNKLEDKINETEERASARTESQELKVVYEHRLVQLNNLKVQLNNLTAQLSSLTGGVYFRIDGELKCLILPYNDTVEKVLSRMDEIHFTSWKCSWNGTQLSPAQVSKDICEIGATMEYPICVLTKLKVRCRLGNDDDIHEVAVAPNSTIESLLTKVAMKAPFECCSKDLIVKCGSSVIEDHKSPVCLFDKTFFIEHRSLTIQEKLEKSCQVIPGASQFANVSSRFMSTRRQVENKLDFLGAPLCYHRGRSSHHVSIYYDEFDNFASQCETIAIEREDCQHAFDFCLTMQGIFANEDERQDAFIRLMEGYFIKHRFKKSAMGVPLADVYTSSGVLFVELKNEESSTTCDSLLEVCKYFIDHAAHSNQRIAYLLTLVGPKLTIYGAVYGKCLLVDLLVPPIWLVDQRNNVKAMEQIARTLKSLKICLPRLEVVSADSCEFPFFQSYKDGGEEVKIEYKEEIALHLFRATLKSGEHEEKCVVKFADSYGSDVHQALAREELAPKLFTTQKIGRFTAVVTAEVENSLRVEDYLHENSDKRDTIFEQFERVKKTLCENNFVHGDLRSCNMLVDQGKVKLQVIDFDWAGKEGTAKYPYFLNHSEIKWPNGVTDGGNITREHDEYWLNELSTVN